MFQKAEKILAYAPLGNEADIRFAIEAGWKQNKRIAFPKVFGDTMKYFEVSDFSELEEGTFHVMDERKNDRQTGRMRWYWCRGWHLTGRKNVWDTVKAIMIAILQEKPIVSSLESLMNFRWQNSSRQRKMIFRWNIW